MARQSSERPEADPPPVEPDETPGRAPDETPDAVDEADAVDQAPTPSTRRTPTSTTPTTMPTSADLDPAAHRALWEELRIDPVEIALPAGTGYTLRAYRLSTELTPTDTADRDDDDPFAARARDAEEEDDETVVILDEEFLDEDDPRTGRHHGRADNEELDVVEDETDDEALAEEDEADEDERRGRAGGRGRGGRGGTRLPHPPWQAAALPQRRVAGELRPFRRAERPRAGRHAGRRWPSGCSPTTSRRWTKTRTSSTSSWRTCAAVTTPGTRR